MNDDDFKQIMLDYFSIEQQRYREIMTQGSDILAKITEMKTSFDALKAALEKELVGVSETIPAGHSAVLDTFVAPMTDLKTQMDAFAAEIPAKVAKIAAAIPPAAPAA
jgi:hypothetical protein